MAPFKVNLASGLAVASYMIYRYPKTTLPVLKVCLAIDHQCRSQLMTYSEL